jgi:uncharacterized membrane protein
MDPVNDNRYYKFGVFYFNPDDERVIVPKRIKEFGFGLNFARREAILVLIAIILFVGILITLFSV